MLVTASDVVDEANYPTCLIPMAKQAEDIPGVRGTMTLGDAGYFGGKHLEEFYRRGQQVMIPDMVRPTDHPYHKD